MQALFLDTSLVHSYKSLNFINNMVMISYYMLALFCKLVKATLKSKGLFTRLIVLVYLMILSYSVIFHQTTALFREIVHYGLKLQQNKNLHFQLLDCN